MKTGLELVPWETIMAEIAARFPAYLVVVEYQPEGIRKTNLRMHSGDERSACSHAIYGMIKYATVMLDKKVNGELTTVQVPGLDQPPPAPPTRTK